MSHEDLHEWLQAWSDGLPVVPPTPERVADMLAATKRPVSQVIGEVPPMYKKCTVLDVAANAVLAGCDPPTFPVVLAAVEAMLDDAFGIHGVAATTMGATPLLIVNGPVRISAGFNASTGALQGAGSRANVCVGRALKLVLHNVGGARLGGTESSTLGTPMKISMCISEHEEKLSSPAQTSQTPSWQPYHISRGMVAGTSSVSVLAAVGGPTQLADFTATSASEVIDLWGRQLATCMSSSFAKINECTLIVCPEHYDLFREGGVASKEDLSRRVWKSTNVHLAPVAHKIVYTYLYKGKGKHWLLAFLLSCIVGVIARILSLFNLALGSIAKFTSPESFSVVVAGGDAGKFSAFVHGFGVGDAGMASYRMSSPVTRTVELDKAEIRPHVPAGSSALRGLVDPRGSEITRRVQLTPRADQFKAGDTIGLMDINKTNGNYLLDRIELRLRQSFPQVDVKRYAKPTFCKPCPESLRRRIVSECSAVVCALAD